MINSYNDGELIDSDVYDWWWLLVIMMVRKTRDCKINFSVSQKALKVLVGRIDEGEEEECGEQR